MYFQSNNFLKRKAPRGNTPRGAFLLIFINILTINLNILPVKSERHYLEAVGIVNMYRNEDVLIGGGVVDELRRSGDFQRTVDNLFNCIAVIAVGFFLAYTAVFIILVPAVVVSGITLVSTGCKRNDGCRARRYIRVRYRHSLIHGNSARFRSAAVTVFSASEKECPI